MTDISTEDYPTCLQRGDFAKFSILSVSIPKVSILFAVFGLIRPKSIPKKQLCYFHQLMNISDPVSLAVMRHHTVCAMLAEGAACFNK